MKNWLLKLPVRFKLFVAFGSILLMSVLLLSFGIATIRTVISYNELSEKIDLINVATLNMSAEVQQFAGRGFKHEKFHTEGKSNNLESYHTDYQYITKTLAALSRESYFQKASNREKLNLINTDLESYNSAKKQLIEAFATRGFQDFGLEGQLRSAIHGVEDSSFPFNKVTMLTLRRHEKDFFLRKNLKYLERFQKVIDQFKSEINNLETNLNKQTILASIDTYSNFFSEIVEVEKLIGLNENSGIRGEVSKNFDQLQENLINLTADMKEDKENAVQESMILLFSLLGIQILLGGLLITFYSGLLAKSIKEIKSSLVSMTEGKFPEPLSIFTKDEIGAAKSALNNLVERVRTAVDFSNELGEGNLTAEYNQGYRDDVLAKSIMTMQKELLAADKKQREINWLNEGLAEFNDILKNESENLEVLADQMISSIIHYVGANQGALFIRDEEQLTAIATYAYGKKKFVDNKIQIGQGLVGQCAIEQEHIHMTDIPQEYLKITSGLGEATPTNLIIFPLKRNTQVMGVLEIASFNNFSYLHIQYLNKISESIASILSSKKTSEKTLELLAEAREKSATLSAHEEELRQNSEELQATQEEMERQKHELEQTIIHLKKELIVKEEMIVEFRKSHNHFKAK